MCFPCGVSLIGFCSSYIKIITDGILCICSIIDGHEEWELGKFSRMKIAGPNCGLVSPTKSPTWVMSGISLIWAHLMPRKLSLEKGKLPFVTNQHSLNTKPSTPIHTQVPTKLQPKNTQYLPNTHP